MELVQSPVDLTEILEKTQDSSAGGFVFFLGKVRDFNQGREVKGIDYEAYSEMAIRKMQDLEAATRARWPVKQIAIVHRTGYLKLGDISVVIAVACEHRADAFEACRFVIDTLKETVPIWKKEHFADTEAWVKGVMPKVEGQPIRKEK